MASIKRFEEFVSEMDRAEEIEADVVAKGTPDVKSEEETEEEAEEVQGLDEAGEANIGDDEEIKEEVLVKAFNENDLTNDWRKKL